MSEAVKTKPASTAAGKSEKHHRILEAAIAVIAQKGFFQARVAEIAERAGVADGTIYLYFKNKEQILMAAIDSAFSAFLARARVEAQDHSLSPEERLRRLAHLHLQTLGSNRDLALVFQTELRQSARILEQFTKTRLVEYFALIRGVVREGQQAGEFRCDVAEKIAANCFFGALDEMVTSWMLSENPYPLAGAADAVLDVIVRGMQSRPGSKNGPGQ